VSLSCLLALLAVAPLLAAAAAPAAPALDPVPVDYFYEPGCADCLRVSNAVMPRLVERFEGFYRLQRWDVGVPSNVVRLIATQTQLGIRKNESVLMVVDNRHVLNGYTAIHTGLLARMDAAVAERLAPGWTPPPAILIPTGPPAAAARRRLADFTCGAVMVAGLLDGINPCAISTLVFFMSLLSVARVRGRPLLLMGVAFCAASFLTYTALGFGLLRLLHLSAGFHALRRLLDGVLTVLLLVLALLSWRDAWRYARTRSAHAITLQLPTGIKALTHRIMHRGLASSHLFAAGLLVGSAVTALESVCTGQVYLPTLLLVVRGGDTTARAWFYLLLYNLMFVLPLVGVFTVTFLGMRTATLLEWSRREVVLSKALLGAFFLAMAALVAVL